MRLSADDKELETDRREVYRYLGYRRAVPDAAVRDEIEACIGDLEKAVTPRYIYRYYDLETISTEDPGLNVLKVAGMEIRSRNLTRTLRGCREAAIMACTLGLGPDRLIARANVTGVSRAAIYQAASAAMIETVCDEVNEQIRKEAEKRGLYCRPRFSPGYGDLPLELQAGISRALNMAKEAGIFLSESLLMTPSKSVTAIIGLSDIPQPCHVKGCEACSMADTCSFRRA